MSGSAGVAPSPSPPAAGPPRPDPLAYPPPTTARYVILVLALLAGGLYIGAWVHNILVGDEWLREDARCRSAVPADVAPLDASYVRAECMTGAEQRRAAYAAAGGAATFLAALATLVVAPAVIERRRRLRTLPGPLAATRARVQELAEASGLRRPPLVMLGGTRQRDAFSYGFPGRYRVALPPKAALRPHDVAVFDPLLRHELAHLAHHDVALAWLARSLWFAFAPLLLVPVVLSALQEELPVTLEYVGRAAVVLLTVRLVADALLRAREHDADLAAGRDPQTRDHLRALLARIEPGPGGGTRSFWRGLRAQHPGATRRQEVLEDPTLALHPSPADGATAAFLAATAAPLVESTASSVLTALAGAGVATAIAAVLSGSLLGAAVGLGLWRAALFGRLAHRPLRPLPVALAVGAGLALGRALSLGQVTTGLGVSEPAVLLVPFLAGVGATAVTAGLALLWADAAPHVRSARPHALAALLSSGLVFAGVAFASEAVVTVLDARGPRVTVLSLVESDPSWLVLLAGLVAVLAAAWPLSRRRSPTTAPPWAFPASAPHPWPASPSHGLLRAGLLGAGAGGTALLAIAAFRLSAGEAASLDEAHARVVAYVTIAALAGGAAFASATYVAGVRGSGPALLSVPVAVLVVTGGLFSLEPALGGRAQVALVGSVLLTAGSFALVLAVLAGGLALLAHALRRSPAPAEGPLTVRSGVVSGDPWRSSSWTRDVATLLVAAVLTVSGSAFVLADRARLATATVPLPTLASAPLEVQVQSYVQDVALPVTQRLEVVDRAAGAIDADASLTPSARAGRIRTDVVPRVREALTLAERYQAPSSRVGDVHRLVVSYLASFEHGLEALADGLERQDRVAVARALEDLRAARAQRTEWLAAVVELQRG